MAEGGSLQDHIKSMILVTALEASSEILKLAVVTEWMLHEEAKMKSWSSGYNQEGALMTGFRKKQRCHYCNKFGHVRRDCEDYTRVKGEEYANFKGQARSVPDKKAKTGAFKVTITAQDDNSSENESASYSAARIVS